ncbi:hypothetical protein [Arcicella lustrica]|uniref:Uncharacterized protein n=1 Tax=Arcicella lustrica TaxID=2984196 RepID=A0ABU5SKS1_9BACT|nr:hypothetical protein [Arcicella sp. DC25W]MEA5427871.1 hypothetical protein [Arcicella sp. DC25W]
MNKSIIILLTLFFGITLNGLSQSTTPKDFFVGKWEFTVMGTPNGDAKFSTNLIRKDGKLTGELSDPTNPTKEKIAITKIEDSADKITIYFTSSGYDVNLEMSKTDENTLKGSMMGMFDAKGIRLKE